MIKREVKFKTITPLFTGDVDQEMIEIKPASIMGSLRFWFEVICHFSGFNKHFKDDNKKKRIENTQKIYTNILYNEAKQNKKIPKHEVCEKLGLSPTEYYFGATSWESKIGIETIKLTNECSFGNRLNLPFGIMFCDETKTWIDLKKYDHKCKETKCHCWFFPKSYFWGKFKIVFTTESTEIAENILLPLLNFIQNYAFLGGKNNLGFGRIQNVNNGLANNHVKIMGIPIRENQFLDKDNNNDGKDIIDKILGNNGKNNDISDIPYKIKLIHTNKVNMDINSTDKFEYIDNIKILLKIKSDLRKKIKNVKLRHQIFGSTKEENAEATKIIPFIKKEDNRLIPFLISYAGIIHLPEVKHE